MTNYRFPLLPYCAVLALCIILPSLTGCKKTDHEEPTSVVTLSDTMMTRIAFAPVTMEEVRGQLRLNGKVTPDDNKLVEVFPLVGGNVTEVNVELGQFVQKGMVLAVIRSGEVAEYERQLIAAQSDMNLDEKSLRVAQEMFESKLASEKEVLTAQRELDKSRAELKRIQEIFSIYGINNKSEYVVRAPISGFITEKNITRDRQLRSDKADNIFTIAQITDVYVTANVYETDIPRIREGLPAQIVVIAYPDRVFEGKVDRVLNVLDPESKTMKVRIHLPNADFALKPDMNAIITIRYYEGGVQMPAVPSSAVIFDQSKNFVLVYKNRSSIETRAVEVHKESGNTVYIRSGVQPGENVISKNALLVYDLLND